ncbi:MAG: NAD(P)/FAD-dependent oxidoreductase [Oscillospiraceae bacterium]
MYDTIIIGGGPAGLTAAIYARRAGMSTLLLEVTICGGQIINSTSVENYPAIADIAGWQLADDWQKQAAALGTEIRIADVTGIELKGNTKLVKTAKGDFETKTVIIANGAGHRKLTCPGAEELSGRGVSTCATCDGAFFKGKPVAVVGGGNTAFEDALYLSTICESVCIVNRRSQFRAEQHLIDTVISKNNIRLMTPYIPVEIFGDENGRAAGMRIKNTETGETVTLGTPGIFTAIGMAPDNSRFSNVVELDNYGYIAAGEDCRTKTPGVFAAGDTRQKALRQLITAASDGAVAATNAAVIVNSWRD